MSTQRRRGPRGRATGWPVPRGLDLVRLRGAARLGYGGAAVDASGVYVTGPDGEKYLDAAGGAAVPLGHRHAAVVAAFREALEGPVAGSPLLADASRLRLAEQLAAVGPAGLVPLGAFTGGAAALDAGLAVARAITGRERVVGVAGEPSEVQPSLIEATLDGAAAIVLEPLPPATFAPPVAGELRRLAAAAERCGALVVSDERGLGIGRSGTLIAAEALGLRADLVVVGGLGGGLLPVALLLGTPRVAAAVEAADLQGCGLGPGADEGWAGPLACAVAAATLDALTRESWPARGAAAGGALGRALEALEAEAPDAVAEVRGVGLAWAIECSGPEVAEELVRSLALDRILVVPPARGGRIVRLLPPLVVEPRELDFVASSIGRALEDA